MISSIGRRGEGGGGGGGGGEEEEGEGEGEVHFAESAHCQFETDTYTSNVHTYIHTYIRPNTTKTQNK